MWCSEVEGWGQSAWESLQGRNTQHQEKNSRPSMANCKTLEDSFADVNQV